MDSNSIVYWEKWGSSIRGVLREVGEGEVGGGKRDCWGLCVCCKGLGPDVVVSSWYQWAVIMGRCFPRLMCRELKVELATHCIPGSITC